MILEFYKIQPWLVQLDPCGHGPEEEKKRLYLGHGFPAKVWAFSLMERKPYPSTREKNNNNNNNNNQSIMRDYLFHLMKIFFSFVIWWQNHPQCNWSLLISLSRNGN
jgi:hypothetical protein